MSCQILWRKIKVAEYFREDNLITQISELLLAFQKLLADLISHPERRICPLRKQKEL